MEFKKKKKNHTQSNIFNVHNYSKKKMYIIMYTIFQKIYTISYIKLTQNFK